MPALVFMDDCTVCFLVFCIFLLFICGGFVGCSVGVSHFLPVFSPVCRFLFVLRVCFFVAIGLMSALRVLVGMVCLCFLS